VSIRPFFSAAAAALTIAQTASGQIFDFSPSYGRPGSWSIDVGGQFARPVGDFRSQVDGAWGAGVSVRHHRHGTFPLGARADFAYLNYGNERKRVPLSPTLNRVLVDMNTSNNIALLSIGPELAVQRGPVRPYAYGFVGFSSFFTQSSAGDDNGGSDFASTTNFSDNGLMSGWGAGLRLPLRFRTVDASVDAGARLTHNGVRNYLKRGDIIDQADGSLAFNARRTAVDFWQYHLGMTFSPRRRR